MTRVPWLGNSTYSENRDGAEREIREKVERRCVQQRNRESIWTIASGIFGFVEKYVQDTCSQKCAYIYIFVELYVSELFGERRNICKNEFFSGEKYLPNGKWRWNRDNAQGTEEDKRDEGKETKKCRVSGTRVLNCGWKYTSKCKRATRGSLPLWFTSVTDAHHGFACRHLDQVFP